MLAPPIVVFRSTPVTVNNAIEQKGYIEFCGLAVIERLEMVVQRDPKSDRTFPNLAVDLVVVDLSPTNDDFDWRWIDARRAESLTLRETHSMSPPAWQRWVKQGRAALPRVRRRVLSSRVLSSPQQRPDPGGEDSALLERIYRHFDGRKHAFEHLSASVAAQMFERNGGRYVRGWITRAGGDGGMDFVGRLDAGIPEANAPLVVLGQAKCIKLSSSISPDEVARVVARLRRGWIGVFVTTGVFSQQAQVEVIDDEYPIVLVHGKQLAREVRLLAETSFGGDTQAVLDSATSDYEWEITHRRPEEILSEA